MKRAIELAKEASTYDEVPVGAVIVKDNKIIAEGTNHKERENMATRHAEIEAIEKASKVLGNWYLEGCEMYVTLEPCLMCCGAIINARLDSVYFGAYDSKTGCCGSVYNMLNDKHFNHQPKVEGGILQEECSKLLTEFFSKKRMEKNNENNCRTR